jgi:hypothetical protein
MTEWISVKDRLPEDITDVLTYGYHWKHQIAQLDFLGGNEKAWYGKNIGFIGRVNSTNITHWMPLPYPPKEITND